MVAANLGIENTRCTSLLYGKITYFDFITGARLFAESIVWSQDYCSFISLTLEPPSKAELLVVCFKNWKSRFLDTRRASHCCAGIKAGVCFEVS